MFREWVTILFLFIWTSNYLTFDHTVYNETMSFQYKYKCTVKQSSSGITWTFVAKHHDCVAHNQETLRFNLKFTFTVNITGGGGCTLKLVSIFLH